MGSTRCGKKGVGACASAIGSFFPICLSKNSSSSSFFSLSLPILIGLFSYEIGEKRMMVMAMMDEGSQVRGRKGTMLLSWD